MCYLNPFNINLKKCWGKLFNSVIRGKVFSKDSNVLKLTKFINAFIVDITYLTKSLISLIGLFWFNLRIKPYIMYITKVMYAKQP